MSHLAASRVLGVASDASGEHQAAALVERTIAPSAGWTWQLPAGPGSRSPHGRGFPPDRAGLALAAVLLRILMPGFLVRGRPGRASLRKTNKAGGFPARRPGEPAVTRVIRRIQFHLRYPWRVT